MTRIRPATDTTTTTVEQIRRLVERLGQTPDTPLFVFDAGYDPIALGHELADERCEVLCRMRDDRVFHTDAPPRPNRPTRTGGRPPRHRPRFKCSDPSTWPQPAVTLTGDDSRYGIITVSAWHGLHPRLLHRGHWTNFDGDPPIVSGTVIRFEVEHLPKPTARTMKTLWLWWSRVREWERLADVDGAHRDAADGHERRRASLNTVGDTTLLDGRFGNLQGAGLKEVFDRFCDAEYHADVAEWRARTGLDTVTRRRVSWRGRRRNGALTRWWRWVWPRPAPRSTASRSG